MADRTDTLAIGSPAPEFLLSGANRDGILSLSGFLSRGVVIDRDRRVAYIYRGDSQTDRAPFSEVMGAVKKLSVSG